MSWQRKERVKQTQTYKHAALMLEIIKAVIESKASRLNAKGFTTISSREIHRHCLELLRDDGKCVSITTYAARLLNRYAERVNSYRTKWIITTNLLEKLFNLAISYSTVRDIPLNNLNNIHFLYIVTSLLYEAKPIEGDADGDRG
jgi:hypothetical protein